MPRVKHRLIAVKSAMPTPGAPAADPAAPAATPPKPTAAPVTDPLAGAHEWAGDQLDAQGQHSDPEQAFALFKGPQGEWAWLDRSDTGVCVGWVSDSDGQVYRYDDVDAWAVDVDDAGMARTDEGAAEAPAEPEEPAAEDPADEPLPMNSEDAAASGGAGSSTRDQTNTPFPNLQGKSFAVRVVRA